MKKLFLSIILASLTFSTFALQAKVVSTKGKTEVQKGSMWVALKEGDVLAQGAVIQTGFKSELVLKINETTVTVEPLSRLTLQTLAERKGIASAKDKDETTIYLNTGALKSHVKKTEDRRVGFTVRSPVATASVRGTAFGVSSGYKTLALEATDGVVAFWENTPESEAILNNSNTNTPVTDPSEGNEPGDISDYAPSNAIVVTKGEAASVSSSGGMVTPSQAAQINAISIGDGTKTASAAELPPDLAGAVTSTGGSIPTGRIVATINFIDE